jgi:pimeloyl-ACP methyl ester carboxylesterase
MSTHSDTFVTIAGCRTHVLRGGKGPPLLFLHGASGGGKWLPFMQLLSQRFDVIAPEHPGFGQSDDPPWLDRVDDLAYFYLDLMQALDLKRVHLVGTSLGGWLAAEMAIRSTQRLETLTLVCAVGLLANGQPIGDIMRLPPEEHARRFCADEAGARARLEQLKAADPRELGRNRATVVRLAWRPRFYSPDLGKWLHRIDKPTLLLWGDSDGLVPVEFGEAYAAVMPGARLEVLARAGHAPYIDQPQAFVAALERFMDRPR